jgi:hypothetical protein
MSLNEIEEDGKVVVEFTNIVDKELIDSIVNEPLLFDNLDIEADVNELGDIKNMCEHYAKHMDLDDNVKNKFEYQFFECICVMAYVFVPRYPAQKRRYPPQKNAYSDVNGDDHVMHKKDGGRYLDEPLDPEVAAALKACEENDTFDDV